MTLFPNLRAHRPSRLRARARTLPAELHRPAAQLIGRLARTILTALSIGLAYSLANSFNPDLSRTDQILLGVMWTAVSLLIAEVMLLLAQRNARHLDIPSSLREYETVITPTYQRPVATLQVTGMFLINFLAQPGPPTLRVINATLLTISALSLIHLLRLGTPLHGLLRAAPPPPSVTAARPARAAPGVRA